MGARCVVYKGKRLDARCDLVTAFGVYVVAAEEARIAEDRRALAANKSSYYVERLLEEDLFALLTWEPGTLGHLPKGQLATCIVHSNPSSM